MFMNPFHFRAAIGLLQGIALYALYRASDHGGWLALHPLLFSPLLLAAASLPLLCQTGVGALRPSRLAAWLAGLALAVAVVGAHDRWRVGLEHAARSDLMPGALAMLGVSLLLFIAWPLILAGESERRWRASYPAYFDTAWKLGLQLMFSGLFVGVFWLILNLGAELFALVGIGGLRRLIGEAEFAIPASTLALSAGLHLSDVRPGIIQGLRSLLLTLLSWLLPLLALLIGAFLALLPFTGLDSLWKTGHASALLLGASGLLIFLLNTAYQDGNEQPGRVIRLSLRAACLLLAPLQALAAYALALRVGQYGWSPDRVFAASLVILGACYAVGYGWAALRRQAGLAGVACANIGAAWLSLALLAAVLTPLADPARISVSSQLSRLQAGRVAAERFDFDFLRYQGLRYGHAALLRLRDDPGVDGAIRRKAGDALSEDKPQPKPPAQAVRPRGPAPLPAGFLAQDWKQAAKRTGELPSCLLDGRNECDAYVGDYSGGGKPEVLLAEKLAARLSLFQRNAQGLWTLAATYDLPAACPAPLEALAAGQARAVPPLLPDLDAGGLRLRPRYPYAPQECPVAKK
ncbi:hypothetical protein BKX93_18745 [Chromobacterium vaccinii]|uniref:DUF4153 domain-containing protein n=2 Tax=Chromobacterium vaccinii TaxID=1108595 RepID=A0A1D9LKW8_9NEIS|nr:hypothetical protein BKX93_18745 [Chromobacterium vaccinii]